MILLAPVDIPHVCADCWAGRHEKCSGELPIGGQWVACVCSHEVGS